MKEKKMLWIGLGVGLILIMIVAVIFLFGNTKDQKEDTGNEKVVESTEEVRKEFAENVSEEPSESAESIKETVTETEESVTVPEESVVAESEEVEETNKTDPTPDPAPETSVPPAVKPTQKPSPTPSTQPTPPPSIQVTPEPTKEPVATPEPTPEPTKDPVTLPAPEPTPEPTAPEHTHVWIEHWMFTPTCGQQGYVTVKCSLCGAIDEEMTGDVAPLGHIIEGYIIDEGDCVSPSCTAYRCTVCGAENVQSHSMSVGPGKPDAHVWEESKELVFDEELFDFVEVPIVKCDRCNARKE